MKRSSIIGFIAGLAVGVAGSVATAKVVSEIKEDFKDTDLVSPDGDNTVTLTCGTSSTARGLSLIKVRAHKEEREDDCKLTMVAGKNSKDIHSEWSDNNHFSLVVGEGKLRQLCNVDFSGEEIKMVYSLTKAQPEDEAECEAECDGEACDEEIATEE